MSGPNHAGTAGSGSQALPHLAALLATLEPHRTDELERLREALYELCGDLDVVPYTRYLIGEACRALSDLLQGDTSTRAAALTKAREFLQVALGETAPSAAPSAAAPPSALEVLSRGGTVRLKPWGDLVGTTAVEVRDGLLRALEGSENAAVLDLSRSRNLDAAGLAVVLGLFKSCASRGRGFSVVGAAGDGLSLFRLLNLTALFSVEELAGE